MGNCKYGETAKWTVALSYVGLGIIGLRLIYNQCYVKYSEIGI